MKKPITPIAIPPEPRRADGIEMPGFREMALKLNQLIEAHNSTIEPKIGEYLSCSFELDENKTVQQMIETIEPTTTTVEDNIDKAIEILVATGNAVNLVIMSCPKDEVFMMRIFNDLADAIDLLQVAKGIK